MALFILDFDDTVANTTEDLDGDYDNIPSLTLVDGAREFLERYGDRSIILSCGFDNYQQQKIDVVGVRSLVRQVLIVSTPEDKDTTLVRIVAATKIAPCEIVVVGDRPDQEIRMGNLLNCTTVRIRLPMGKYYGFQALEPEDRSDFTVANFHELMKLPLPF